MINFKGFKKRILGEIWRFITNKFREAQFIRRLSQLWYFVYLKNLLNDHPITI